MIHTRRLAAAAAALAVTASLAATAQAAGSSPAVQAQQLAAAQKTFAARLSAVEAKLGQQANTNMTTRCGSAGQALPKSKQSASFGMILSYAFVSGAEALARAFVAHDRDVAALHLTDPALSQYAAALHEVATLETPLQAAKPVGACTFFERWEKDGYPESGPKVAALFGLTTAQAKATDLYADSNLVLKAFMGAKTAADARLRALGVTPVTLNLQSS